MKRIIDISYYQDPSSIDYDKLLDQVDGVIIRLGYGTGTSRWPNQPDPAFEQHYAEIKARGVPVGCYHFIVEYKSVDDQLNIVVKPALQGKHFELGFWPDVELEGGATPLTKATVTEYIDKMDAYLFKGIAGIYTGAWCWNPIMGTNNPYSHKRLWVASYSSSPYLPHGWDKWFMWQYSSSGRLDGYASNLDMNSVSDANWEGWVGDIEPPTLGDPLFKAKVLAFALNVRSTPVYYADNRNVVGQIYEGEIKDVYAVNEANGWYQLGLNKWCSGHEKYMERIEIDPPQPPMTLEERVARLELEVFGDGS